MFIADFHIHSKYARATSKDCVPEFLDLWARRKGLDLIGTGDFTHAGWRQELREKLVPTGDGLYALKQEYRADGEAGGAKPPRFMVTGEISSIYKKNGKVRKVHNLILLPDLDAADALSRRLSAIGNLHSDGRPILGLDSKALLEITLDTCPEAMFIPAHIWTPHFSLFGAYSGFDDIAECFEDMTPYIHALETGLSSNPPMNWRLSALDRFTLVSNSDAHSPANLSREANVFDTALSYPHIAKALSDKASGAFYGTLEFFPEEGKYHFDGHRACGVCQSPASTRAARGVCPVCGGRITVGVLHRVEALADRPEGFVPPDAPRYESLIPLPEVIAASTGLSATSAKGRTLYARLLRELGPELHILRSVPLCDIAAAGGPAMAEGLRRLRAGQVDVRPGYDGEYGKVRILDPDEIAEASGQTRLFLGAAEARASFAQGTPSAEGPAAAPPAVLPEEKAPAPDRRSDDLNAEQKAAAFSDAPVTAVLAGPGTGKTKTLVARIAHLVKTLDAAPASVVAVTFTNKAAGEMRERLFRQWDDPRAVKAMRIGTFHALCLDLLKKRGEALTLLDGEAAKSVVEEVLREQKISLPLRDALREISLIKCGASGAPSALPEGVYEAYNARLMAYGAMDFDDILLRALEEETPDARFDHLLVDEFQDMNPVQYRLLQKWARNSRSVFVIGDADQAIYGFRGSSAACFAWLRADFPDLLTVALSRNYRSTAEILSAAAPIVGRGPGLHAERGSGGKVRAVEADSAFSEALFIAKEIGRAVGGIDMQKSGAPTGKVWGFSDIAVLYRLNRQAALLEECLSKEGIPYVVSGRDAFLSHPETVRLLAFWKLLLNPGDAVALRTCLKALAGFDEKQIRPTLETYRASEKTLASLCAVLEKAAAQSGALPLFSDQIRRFGQAAHKEKPRKLITKWLLEQGVSDQDWADKFSRMAVFHDRMADLLRAVTLGQESDIRRYGGKKYTGDAVSLMTLHASKGLEFPVVFLTGVTDGLIPHRGRGDGPADESEERRLFYVGMTRAKDELILVHSGAPSPFLSDLPPELVDRQALPRRKSAVAKQVSFLS